MADRMTKKQRSRAMAAVRSEGNQTTEVALARVMRTNRISGWRRHLPGIIGKPDFVFLKQKIAVFVDGCFWHGCSRCGTIPKTNKGFWQAKITRNIKRDQEVRRILKKDGWKVVRVWEHELKRGRQIEKIVKKLV